MKRKMILVLCFLLLIGMTAFAAGKQEVKKIAIRWTDIPEALEDVENGDFMKALYAKFPEVTFKLEPMMYSAMPEKMPVLMASGDMPDILSTSTSTYLPQLVEGKLIAPLDDALKAVGKDLLGNARDGQLALGVFMGKQYAVPNSYSLKWFTQMIRMDWLDKLGLKVPVTMDEFREVARAFTLKDPDGNGKQDTYGTAFRANVNFIDSFFLAYGVASSHHQIGMWRIRGGKQTFDWVQPQMKEALMNLASWYKEGLIDPESLTYDWNNWYAKLLQSKFGMWYHQQGRLNEVNSSLVKAGFPNAKMWPIDPPKGPYGQGTFNEGQPWGKVFAARNLNKAIEVYNYTATQEFYLASKGEAIAAYPTKPDVTGPNGWPVYYTANEAATDPNYETRRKHFLYSAIGSTMSHLENPNMYKTWPNQDLAKYLWQSYLNTMGPAQVAGNEKSEKWAQTTSKPVPVPADAKYFVNLQTAFREMCTKIVSGKDADSTWNDWIKFYNANGGPEIEAQVNQLMPAK